MATRILVLVTKNENLGASWPQDFFLKVEHCRGHQNLREGGVQTEAISKGGGGCLVEVFFFWGLWVRLMRCFWSVGQAVSYFTVNQCFKTKMFVFIDILFTFDWILFSQLMWQFFLRWLDTVFQGQYLPSLSINFVAINKVLEKLPPQLY